MKESNSYKRHVCVLTDDTVCSNVAQILIDEDVLDVLRLCGASYAAISSDAADYERFCALAECLPLLIGHPLKARIRILLKELFRITEELTPQTKDRIWLECADQLLQRDVTRQDAKAYATKEPLFSDAFYELDTLSYLCPPILTEAILSKAEGRNWNEWCLSAIECLDPYDQAAENGILLSVPKEYAFKKPDLYHVDLYLSKQKQATLEYLWLTQRLRFLCEQCKARGWTLILQIAAKEAEAVALLSYLEEAVGLPRLIWLADTWETRAAIWNFQKKRYLEGMYFAIRQIDPVSPQSTLQILSEIAKQYPIGRLKILT